MPLNLIVTAAGKLKKGRQHWWSRFLRGFKLPSLAFVGALITLPACAADHWTELNIGPFQVYSQGDVAFARKVLTSAEQVRWVLGGLLEVKDLRSLWPIRIVIVKSEQHPDSPGIITQNGQYVLVLPAGSAVPLASIATVLLRDNTPRLPDEIESGLPALFSSLHAEGSRVTWGGPVEHPDLDWARMQLFATRFEYGAGFHIFISSLANGSSIRVAEKNAFGKDSVELEAEAAAILASAHSDPVPVSGRPLDPKRDFGEHNVDGAEVRCYLADAAVLTKPAEAEAAFKAAVAGEGPALALGYEGLADLARNKNQDADRFLQDAMRAGSTSAPVYLAAAQSRQGEGVLPLLKRAQHLNERWAEPVFQQGEQTEDLKAREELYRKATVLDPRGTEYWLALAQLQVKDGHALQAQGTWIRAEDSALTPEEKDRIHQLRMAGEDERLDAADAERRRERDAVHLADQRAQSAEEQRIRAAEEKANRAVEAAGGEITPQNVVPWDETLQHKQAKGVLTNIECGRKPARAFVKDQSGRVLQLTLDQIESAGLSCGTQQPAPKVSFSYAVDPDRPAGVVGRVLDLQILR